MILLFLLIGFVFCDITHYSSLETESQTSSTTHTTKLSLTINVPAARDYLVEWTSEIQTSSDTVDIAISFYSIEDTGKRALLEPVILNEEMWAPGPSWKAISSFKVVSLTRGTHIFKMDYATTTKGIAVAMRRTRIKVEKINLA